jgi:hypothetical protein
MTCQVIQNNELIINEAHNNNFIFVLERMPSSFLMSKFKDDEFQRLTANPESIINKGADAIRESNQDTYNFALYLQSFTLPDLNLQTSNLDTSFANIPIVSGKLEFGTLNMNIMGDDGWFVYRMLLYWMYAAANPEEFNNLTARQYAKYFYMNGHLMLLDDHHEKVLEFEFRDLHIQNMSQQELSYQNADKIILSTTWTYSTFVPSDDIAVIKKV